MSHFSSSWWDVSFLRCFFLARLKFGIWDASYLSHDCSGRQKASRDSRSNVMSSWEVQPFQPCVILFCFFPLKSPPCWMTSTSTSKTTGLDSKTWDQTNLAWQEFVAKLLWYSWDAGTRSAFAQPGGVGLKVLQVPGFRAGGKGIPTGFFQRFFWGKWQRRFILGGAPKFLGWNLGWNCVRFVFLPFETLRYVLLLGLSEHWGSHGETEKHIFCGRRSGVRTDGWVKWQIFLEGGRKR